MPQGYEAGCYLPSKLQRWPFKTLAWQCRHKPPFIMENLDLFPSRSINFLYLHLVRTMCFEQFVLVFFQQTLKINLVNLVLISLTNINQFVPVKGDRPNSSHTSINFRQAMPVCPIFLSYTGVSLKELY